MDTSAAKKIRFLRQYGPVPRNDNMFDEDLQRAVRRTGITPVAFEHPRHKEILACFDHTAGPLMSVILTGDAGDGKTHLCGHVWRALGGDLTTWGSDDPYLSLRIPGPHGLPTTLHIIRDVSGWAPQGDAAWTPEKSDFLHHFCRVLYEPEDTDVYLLAVNDGQLVETWRRLPDTPYVVRARDLFETLLVEDRQSEEGVHLRFFNLSRGSSAEMFDRALMAFLAHEAWQPLRDMLTGPPAVQESLFDVEGASAPALDDQAFGPKCPIRRNYELLTMPLVQKRLRALFELCDYNNLHIPIRQILLLLTNAILGHPDVKDYLMVPADIPGIIRRKTVAKASFYNNVFGGNLPDTRRESLTIFSYLERFRIGYETSNRIDNVLIFGDADENVRPYFEQLLAADTFYGADEGYRTAQHAYVEGADEDDASRTPFLKELVKQRRGLFFKIPEEQEEELGLWDLTVFKYAGEYLSRVVRALSSDKRVERPIRARLVKGLNRIFVGMLIASDRELVLATSLSFSNARVSRLLEERISVEPRLGERVEIVRGDRVPTLDVAVSRDLHCPLPLHLTRYEFLSRVAEGALPNSFSKECYEDMLAFKSQILAALTRRRQDLEEEETTMLTFRLLTLDAHGGAVEETVEVLEPLDA